MALEQSHFGWGGFVGLIITKKKNKSIEKRRSKGPGLKAFALAVNRTQTF